MRAGAHALSLLSVPLNVEILKALEEGSKPTPELRRAVGSPAPTTMRSHLRQLTELGVTARSPRNRFPGNTDVVLTRAGRDLLPVCKALESWLAAAPLGVIGLGTPAAKSSIKALVEGWSKRIVRALAARPLSLTELDGLISSLSYPSLERRLVAMRDAGLIAARPSDGRGTPYAVTDWLRRAVPPLAAGAQWERRHIPTVAPAISRLDVEAAFLLAVPMLRLQPKLSGACRLAVQIPNGGDSVFAGVLIDIRDGEVLSCSSRLSGSVDAAASGPAGAWLRAVAKSEPAYLDRSGDPELTADLLDGLHGALLAVPQLR